MENNNAATAERTKENTMAPVTRVNPNFGQAFTDDRFGEGSVLVTITEEGLFVLTKNLQIGSKLLFRFNKETKFGNKHYFCEILPPWGSKKKKAMKSEEKTSNKDEDSSDDTGGILD